ncbi:MAG: rhomboid family intramembrane serine protease [Verrucomicrobiota bacterium]
MRNSKNPLQDIAVFILALFAVQLVNLATGMGLTRFGIIPRSLIGLRGIFFSPLIHGSWAHLLANVGPLAVMLGLLSFHKKRSIWATTGAIWLTTGFATWLFGRPGSIQIGASGVIYGLATYLITAAWTDRDLGSAFIALLVIVVYGGLFWGLFPTASGVSWEGHVCGATSGIMVARASQKSRRR